MAVEGIFKAVTTIRERQRTRVFGTQTRAQKTIGQILSPTKTARKMGTRISSGYVATILVLEMGTRISSRYVATILVLKMGTRLSSGYVATILVLSLWQRDIKVWLIHDPRHRNGFIGSEFILDSFVQVVYSPAMLIILKM